MHKSKFKDLKRAVQRNLRRAYWSYIENIVTPNDEDHSSNNNNRMKRFRAYIKHKKTDSGGKPSLKRDGTLHTDSFEKPTIYTQLQSAFSQKINIAHEEFVAGNFTQGTFPSCPDLNITCAGIEELLKNLNPHKAAGPDIALILCEIFKNSLESGAVPEDWRKAHIIPIYKKGQRYKAEKYRPVSLTCMCCTLMEHIVTSHIMRHADDQNILYPLQHGFRSNILKQTPNATL